MLFPYYGMGFQAAGTMSGQKKNVVFAKYSESNSLVGLGDMMLHIVGQAKMSLE